MKPQRLLIILVVALFVFLMLGGFGSLARNGNSGGAPKWGQPASLREQDEASATPQDAMDEQDDPDLPGKFRGKIDKEAYLRARDEFIGLKRGMERDRPFDPMARGRAISQMERQEKGRLIESMINGSLTPPITTDAAWTALGPAPLPNGGNAFPVSGRVTSVVVDPTNASKVYLGTAQGGVWRSLDGGTTWTAIFDSADSLAIGALAMSPQDPTKLYVGTGEFNGCGDCFFGVGLYRIDTVDTAPSLVGPINPFQTIGSLAYNIFTGRSISRILVDPTNAATIFVATARGVGGSGANAFSSLPPMATRGVYRSMNATSAAGSVTFQKLTVAADNCFDSPCTGNTDISDMAMEPGVPNNILVNTQGVLAGLGGIYRTTNALSPTPTFSQVLSLNAGTRVNFAINKIGGLVTVYASTSETPTATPGCTGANSGAVRKSVNGGATWSGQLTGGGGFCAGQCFYDMPIAVSPTDANLVYIGGQSGSSPGLTCTGVVRKSTDGGASFSNDSNGLHADDHSLVFDGFGNIYTGNDGGVWKRSATVAAGTAWTNLNNAPLNTMQFVGIASHPTDRNFMIGGTQDNGTEYQQTTGGNWLGAESGDGGYALIDQSATDTINVTMYHTFYNCNPTNCPTGSQIGFDRAVNTTCLPSFNFWPTRGDFNAADQLTNSCDGTANLLNNGISRFDNVLFYAPMALGPGTPNTLYFGSDRLYRSTDRGDHMTVVSQAPISGTSPVSTIAISPQDDNFRIVGLQNGMVWATSTGSSTLVNITGASFPANPNGSLSNKFVGRAVIDPNNKNVAYVAFSFFATAGQGIWKITNLGAASSASPVAAVWTAAGSGIPSIPINALAIDPVNSNNIFAGTDIGVYNSTDGGASWVPFGTGLPRSAVFDLALQNANRVLRAGTHGRGVWEISLASAPSTIQFSASSYSINEGDASGHVNITLTRTGDTTSAASVGFITNDAAGLTDCNVINGIASPRCDYSNTLGTASWAAGDGTSKTFSIAIVNDSYAEGTETFTIGLNNPSGATLGAQSTATVTITDNDATNGPNPIDGTDFFVRQQYIDFLGREPDPPGFAGWTATINNCSGDTTQCDRIHVSQLFFQSAEFQQRGYFVYRFYPVAFGRKPDYSEFVPDLASVSGFLDANQLEAAKVAFIAAFMARPAFANTYNPLTNQQYVDVLLNTAGVTLSSRQAMIDGLNNSTMTRGQVLRTIVESTEVSTKYNHQAYAVMEYFGYLRRQPDSFYLQWIAVLDSTNDPRGMVTGFVTSAEYRNRFGPSTNPPPAPPPLAVSSLDKTSAQPFGILKLTGTGFDRTASPLVKFSNSTGFSVEVPPIAVTATSISVAIPPFVSPTTGALGPATVNVQVLQTPSTGAATSNVMGGFNILNLPTPASQAGTLTLHYLKTAQAFSTTLQGAIHGTSLDTPAMNAALANQNANLSLLIPQIESVVQDPTKSFILGTISGITLTINSTELLRVDRMILGVLATQAGANAGDFSLAAFDSSMVSPLAGTACQAPEAQMSLDTYLSNPNPPPDTLGALSGYYPSTLTSTNCKSPTAVNTGVSVVEGSGAVALGVLALVGAPAETLALPAAALLYVSLATAGGEIAVGGALGQATSGAVQLVQSGMESLDELFKIALIKGSVGGLLLKIGVNPEPGFALASSIYGLLAVHKAFANAPPLAGGGAGGTKFSLNVSTAGTGEGAVGAYPAVITCGGSYTTCNDSIAAGTFVFLSAKPSTGSTFDGWGGACSGTGTCRVLMDSAKSVTATFNKATALTLSPAILNTTVSCLLNPPPGNGSFTLFSGPISVTAPAGLAWTATIPTLPEPGSTVTLTPSSGVGSMTLTVTIKYPAKICTCPCSLSWAGGSIGQFRQTGQPGSPPLAVLSVAVDHSSCVCNSAPPGTPFRSIAWIDQNLSLRGSLAGLLGSFEGDAHPAWSRWIAVTDSLVNPSTPVTDDRVTGFGDQSCAKLESER